jgi:hypothetical protein
MQILHYKQKMGRKPISKAITLKKGLDFSKISRDLKVVPEGKPWRSPKREGGFVWVAAI